VKNKVYFLPDALNHDNYNSIPTLPQYLCITDRLKRLRKGMEECVASIQKNCCLFRTISGDSLISENNPKQVYN